MKQIFFFGVILAAAFLLVSCEQEEPFVSMKITGKGEIVTKTLELSSFTRVELTGVADLNISVGGEQSVVLKAQENIIEVMNWEVDAGVMTISLNEGISLENHEGILFEIGVEKFYGLQHYGIGDVHLCGDATAEFTIDHQGIGQIDAYNYPVDQCTVLSSATGDCMVHVNSFLEVQISGLGNVFYKGNPEINSTDTGMGDLINNN